MFKSGNLALICFFQFALVKSFKIFSKCQICSAYHSKVDKNEGKKRQFLCFLEICVFYLYHILRNSTEGTQLILSSFIWSPKISHHRIELRQDRYLSMHFISFLITSFCTRSCAVVKPYGASLRCCDVAGTMSLCLLMGGVC